MTVTQALHNFYSSFDITAYEENSVLETAKMPYITYNVVTNTLNDNTTSLIANVYYKSNSWTEINKKVEEISNALMNGKRISVDNGVIVLYRGNPFAFNADEGDITIKRKQLNIECDYIII